MGKSNIIFCIMAESAAGKDLIAEKLSSKTGLKRVISYTTRPRRNGEGDDKHIFVTDTEYEKFLSDDNIAAYTNINGFRYWTTKDQLNQSCIYVIDPLGRDTLMDLNLPNTRIVSIYINVPADVRKERARTRGDNMLTYLDRCSSERAQFRKMKTDADFDYAVPNEMWQKTMSVLNWIVNVEGAV